MFTATSILLILIFAFAFVILMVISKWKIYQKAGRPGWYCLIPIYDSIVLLEIVGKPIWWIFLLLIPGVNLVFFVWVINLMSKSFGKDEGFTFGLIILPIIFYPLLAFGTATYQGPAADPAT
ncbi:MAG: hypothetical protein CFE24_13320 [Flavobacterium sp. BFFFF2]|nr:MAG: hypothetical protein CFE24_13320 [Flavobacterium sp. BFFFF2]